jgi:hypothetical protein
MNTPSIIKHAASIIAVSVVLTGAAMQSARAADDNMWFLHQEQQSDGSFQSDDAASTTPTPAASTPAVGAQNQASLDATDQGQTAQSDDKTAPTNQTVYDELQHDRD